MAKTTPANVPVYKRLKKKILSGEFESDSLLRETRLAKQFKVSRTPIREALRRLASERLVRLVPNVGAFVGSMTWDEAREVFVIREVLDALAAQLATNRLDERDIQALEEIIEKQKLAIDTNDLDKCMHCDETFHTILLENCGNHHLIELISNLDDRTKLFNMRRTAFKLKGQHINSYQEHQAILVAIKDGDAERVSRLVWQHAHRFFVATVESYMTDIPAHLGVNFDES